MIYNIICVNISIPQALLAPRLYTEKARSVKLLQNYFSFRLSPRQCASQYFNYFLSYCSSHFHPSSNIQRASKF